MFYNIHQTPHWPCTLGTSRLVKVGTKSICKMLLEDFSLMEWYSFSHVHWYKKTRQALSFGSLVKRWKMQSEC